MGRLEERGEKPSKDSVLSHRLRRGALLVGGLLAAVYGALLFTAGGAEFLESVAGLNPRLLFLPLLATFLSYVTMSLSYDGIARAAGVVIRQRDMLRITFVANTANYILPSGGLSGFALRLVFFTKKGVSSGRAVLISFTQTLITNLMLVVFIVYGLASLVAAGNVNGAALIAGATVATLLTLLLTLCVAMIYRRGLRDRVMAWNLRLLHRILDLSGHRSRFAERVERLFAHVDEGMELFAINPRAMIAPAFWIFLDWLFTIGVLYLSFYSAGTAVTFSQVAIAFSVSIVVAIASFVPGGAGVLEGTLTATFAGLGIPLKASLLPIFVFRMAFYVIPAVLSLLLARGAFAEVDSPVSKELL